MCYPANVMVDCQKTVSTTYYPALERLMWELVEHPFSFLTRTKIIHSKLNHYNMRPKSPLRVVVTRCNELW